MIPNFRQNSSVVQSFALGSDKSFSNPEGEAGSSLGTCVFILWFLVGCIFCLCLLQQFPDIGKEEEELVSNPAVGEVIFISPVPKC